MPPDRIIDHSELVARRLAGQRLLSPKRASAAEIVRELGAVQAQDFYGAKWAIAQRARGLTDAKIDRDFDTGDLIRTHVLRPTWHFVSPEDVRWMLALTAPRIARIMGRYDHEFGLDAKVHRRANDAMARALEGGRDATRSELAEAMERAGVSTQPAMKLTRLVLHAEIERVICSGPRRGRQLSYALFDERVPPAPPRDRDAALLELVRRYFATRGPATLQDFAWWSGLTIGDARRGVDVAQKELTRGVYDGNEHWFFERYRPRKAPSALLLPNYDEYFIGYRDRSAYAKRLGHARAITGGDARIGHVIFVDGEIVGSWKRTTMKGTTSVDLVIEARLGPSERKRVFAETRRLARFLGTPLDVSA